MSLRRVFFVVVPVVLLISAFIYWQLGGFEEVKVEAVEVQNYRLVGKQYVGTVQHPAMEKLFEEIKGHWESGELPGVVTVAVFKEPATEKDTVEQFVGVLLPAEAPLPHLPQGYELLEIPASQAVRASLEANAAVWPTPDKLREAITTYAATEGYPLRKDVLLEKYHGPDRLEVEVPLLSGTIAE